MHSLLPRVCADWRRNLQPRGVDLHHPARAALLHVTAGRRAVREGCLHVCVCTCPHACTDSHLLHFSVGGYLNYETGLLCSLHGPRLRRGCEECVSCSPPADRAAPGTLADASLLSCPRLRLVRNSGRGSRTPDPATPEIHWEMGYPDCFLQSPGQLFVFPPIYFY